MTVLLSVFFVVKYGVNEYFNIFAALKKIPLPPSNSAYTNFVFVNKTLATKMMLI